MASLVAPIRKIPEVFFYMSGNSIAAVTSLCKDRSCLLAKAKPIALAGSCFKENKLLNIRPDSQEPVVVHGERHPDVFGEKTGGFFVVVFGKPNKYIINLDIDYFQISSRLIILFVFRDAKNMQTQGTVIISAVVRITKIDETRRVDLNSIKKIKSLLRVA